MRENYNKLVGDLNENLDIHYIDWNKKNDDMDNLIIIPYKLRQLIHEYLGYVDKAELTKLIKKFNMIRDNQNKTTAYLNLKLAKHVNLNKTSELAISCKEKLGTVKQYKTPKINYRLFYERTHKVSITGLEVHHIDWDHENNDINNLIALPIQLHQLIHSYFGYVDREGINILLIEYNKMENASLEFLNDRLKRFVKMDKTSVLYKTCKTRLIIKQTHHEAWLRRRGQA